MLLELSAHRPLGSSSKMFVPFHRRYSAELPNQNGGPLSTSYDESYSYRNNPVPKSVVQCYSVSTGKVSTLLRSPSQSSISSIEVAEINHLSEFMNSNKKDQQQQVRAIDSSSPPFVKYDPIGEKPVLFSAIPKVKREEVLPPSSRKCASMQSSSNLQTR